MMGVAGEAVAASTGFGWDAAAAGVAGTAGGSVPLPARRGGARWGGSRAAVAAPVPPPGGASLSDVAPAGEPPPLTDVQSC